MALADWMPVGDAAIKTLWINLIFKIKIQFQNYIMFMPIELKFKNSTLF
jgi:hypothetical protein